MKTIFTISLILFINLVLSQTTVEFTILDSCSDKQVEDYDITLLGVDEEMREYLIKKDSIVNVKKGIYLITVNIGEGDYFKTHSYTKEFKSDSIYKVTRKLPKIMRKYTSEIHHQTDMGFYNCDKVCNGKQQDFYRNGKIRMEGEFKNGMPIKQIKKYNDKGELVEIEIYNRNGTYKKSKYPDYNIFVKNN